LKIFMQRLGYLFWNRAQIRKRIDIALKLLLSLKASKILGVSESEFLTGFRFGKGHFRYHFRHSGGDLLCVKSPGNIPSLFLRVEYRSFPSFPVDYGVSCGRDDRRIFSGLGREMETAGRNARPGKTSTDLQR
jgi:hypothetical protein